MRWERSQESKKWPETVGVRPENRHALVGPLAIWKMERDFQIRFLLSVGLRPEHYVLDFGCGTLRGGLPLIAYLQAGHYWGIDVRTDVLIEAQKELRENGLSGKSPVLIHVDDLRKLDIGRRFDIIWAFDVLYILTDEDLNHSLDFARRHLKTAGILFGNALIGTRMDAQWAYGFPMIRRELKEYRLAARMHGLVMKDMGTIASLGLATGQRKHDEKHMLSFTHITSSSLKVEDRDV